MTEPTLVITGWCPYELCASTQRVIAVPNDRLSPYRLAEHHIGDDDRDAICQGSGTEPGLQYAFCDDCQTAVPAEIRLVGDGAWREMVQDLYLYDEYIFMAVLDGHPVCGIPGQINCEGSGQRGGWEHGIVPIHVKATAS